MFAERQQMLRIILVTGLLVSAAKGQAVFDVASIRASQIGRGGEGSRREKVQISPGSLNMQNVSLKSAIRWAYHVMDYQVSGPDWLNFERFDIAAKAAEPASEDQMRMMLQALLAERFKLALHRETKELPAYVLVVAKGGLKFHESQTEGEPVLNPDKARMGVEVKGVPATQFIEMLSNILHAPVINKTGLEGRYDATVNVGKYMPDGSAGAAPFDPVSMVMTALQEELGLKLESKKMALDFLIIDRVEKVPVEN
jgi:uncharacterized protein (TIGR03435 family)